MRQNTIIYSLLAIMFAVWFLFPYEVSAATIKNISNEITAIDQDKVRLKALAASLVEKIESSNNPEQDMEELRHISERISVLNLQIEKLRIVRSEIENIQRKSEAATIVDKQIRLQATESSMKSVENVPLEKKSGVSLWGIGGAILIVVIIVGFIAENNKNPSLRSSSTSIRTGTPTDTQRQHQSFLPQNGGNAEIRPQSGNPISIQNHNRPTAGRPGIDNPRDNGVIPEDIV